MAREKPGDSPALPCQEAAMRKPANPCFSSGPCAKRPGFSLAALEGALLGRSHRAPAPKARLAEVIERSKRVLGMPEDYRLGIVPASDTGAVEMAMWNLLGPRGVDVLAWESFSEEWARDAATELRLGDLRVLRAEYGRLPDLAAVDPARDCVFVWNGTTSGVRLTDGDWISEAREGLTICDATSAAFAMELPWPKLDVVTWSWQKVLGGEAAHGMLALSPARWRGWSASPGLAAAEGLPPDQGRAADRGHLPGDTINTPSMLCVEDALDGLRWAEGIGGLPRWSRGRRRTWPAVAAWAERSPGRASWPRRRRRAPAPASACASARRRPAARPRWPSAWPGAGGGGRGAGCRQLSRRAAGLRIWCGATVETSDVEALLPVARPRL
jgi:phosphoserine aminotransferase